MPAWKVHRYIYRMLGYGGRIGKCVDKVVDGINKSGPKIEHDVGRRVGFLQWVYALCEVDRRCAGPKEAKEELLFLHHLLDLYCSHLACGYSLHEVAEMLIELWQPPWMERFDSSRIPTPNEIWRRRLWRKVLEKNIEIFEILRRICNKEGNCIKKMTKKEALLSLASELLVKYNGKPDLYICKERAVELTRPDELIECMKIMYKYYKKEFGDSGALKASVEGIKPCVFCEEVERLLRERGLLNSYPCLCCTMRYSWCKKNLPSRFRECWSDLMGRRY